MNSKPVKGELLEASAKVHPLFHMLPAAQTTIERKGQRTVVAPLSESGMIICENPGAVRSRFERQQRKLSMKLESYDKFPPGALVILQPGDSRMYASYHSGNSPDGLVLYLDIGAFSSRNRIVLHEGMEIVFMCGDEVRIIQVRIRGSQSSVRSTWSNRLTEDELLTKSIDAVTSSSVSSDIDSSIGSSTGESQVYSSPVTSNHSEPIASRVHVSNLSLRGNVPSKSSLKSGPTTSRKSVTWGTRDDLLKGTKTQIENEDKQGAGEEEDSSSVETWLEIGDKKICEVNSKRRKVTALVGSGTGNKPLDGAGDVELIDLAFKSLVGDGFFGGFLLHSRSAHFLTPRRKPGNNKVLIYLKIPPLMHFPLNADDVLVCHNNREEVARFTVTIPPVCRDLRSGNENVGHSFVDLAIRSSFRQKKVPSHRGVETLSDSEPYTVKFPPKCFSAPTDVITVGRGNCSISHPDPSLSRLHAIIHKERDRFFFITPADDRKDIYLVVGKGESHYRPPVSIKVGDSIMIGKSEFKVIFQQGHNQETSVENELLHRLSKHRLELSLRRERVNSHSAEDDDPSEVGKFSNLHVDALVKQEDVPKMVQSWASLCEFFEMNDHLNRPIMVLQSVRGPRAKEFFICDPLETIMGRASSASISIPSDRKMSDFHCRISYQASKDEWLLEDLESRFGTFLRLDVNKPHMLCCGDQLILGMTILKVFGTRPDQTTTCKVQ